MIKFLGKNKVFNPNILHRVSKNETIFDIAQIYNVNPKILEKKYGTNIYVGKCLIIFCSNKKYHIVKPTETIAGICKQYDISPKELLSKNNITKLFIGQMLEI